MNVNNNADSKSKRNNKSAKKTIILYVLKMLYKGSSKENPVKITSMTKVLHSLGVPCDRRTVSRNIGYIQDFGLPVVKIKGGGCYYDHERDDAV